MSTQKAAASAPGILLPSFEDGLGRRYRPEPRGGDTASEVLCFRTDLTDVPSFEFSLRERVARVADFRHPYYARIRKVDRLTDERGTVALISDCPTGIRLSDIASTIEHGGPVLSLDAALSLIRQLAPAIALLHDSVHVAHGAIALERLFVTPNARLLIVEHVMGAALEQLRYSRERYWKELRVATPMSAGLPRFDKRADLTQLGVVALSLILGRPLRDEEFPGSLDDLIASARARSVEGLRESLPSELREWLRKTLQLDPRRSFVSALEAQTALEQLLSYDGKYNADVSAVQAFLSSYDNPKVPVAPPAWRSKGIIEPPPTHDARVRTVPVKTPVDEPVEAAEAEDEWSIPSEPVPTRPTHYRSIAVGLVLAMAVGGGLLAARRFLSPAPIVTTGVPAVDPTAGTVPVADGASADSELVAPALTTGEIEIRTDPSGVRVSVDNVQYGTSPLIVRELTPGVHTVKVENGSASASQMVTIEAGVASSLVMALIAAPAAPATGWVSVAAPFTVDLFEQGRELGSSATGRLVLPVGRHEIEIVSEPLGFRETRTVQVTSGKLSVIGITPPNGTLSLNAIPWANVSIDGETVGETPIGNLSLTIGPHEVVFRNPKFGEQRRVITVTEGSPVRFSIDMTKR